MAAITLKQIAKECGVSVATVSKALHDASDISEATKKHIRSYAQSFGYAPNAAAQMLKTSRSHNIGLLYEEIGNDGRAHEYFSNILIFFKNKLEKKGYDITFMSKTWGANSLSYSSHASYRSFDGIFAALADFSSEEIHQLIKSEIPFVTLDFTIEGVSSVLSDNYLGMQNLVEYAYSMGHRKISYIHSTENKVGRIRLESFLTTCAKLGIRPEDCRTYPSSFLDIAKTQEATQKILESDDKPTCILFPDDISALGGIKELEKQGYTLGKDMSVAGYDGILLTTSLHPKLTTVHQNTKAIAEKAADILLEQIENPGNRKIETVKITPQLWEGESVAKIN